jgi:hypothetical protein
MDDLERIGATTAFSEVLLTTLVAAGFRPTVQGRLGGGVLVRLHHDRGTIEAEGVDVADCLPELVRQARAYAPSRRPPNRQ